jgi:hypothetical protein
MLDEEEKNKLEADVTITELDGAVDKINLGSAPGIDGLTLSPTALGPIGPRGFKGIQLKA